MKEPYQKPSIRKLTQGSHNKYGSGNYYGRKVRTEIEGQSIASLVERFGSPLFVYSERQVKEKLKELKTALNVRYPKVELAWSYKTNYLQAICALMHQGGSLAEVVSQMEYDKALGLGLKGKEIIFNGPYKPIQALETAFAQGAIVNLDHQDELSDCEQVATQLGRKLKVGLRINLDAGIYPQWSRFGFNLESGQAWEAAKRIKAKGLLEVNGLHCHIGTYIMEPEAYGTATKKLLEFAAKLEAELGYKLDYLDLGGGFPSLIRLKGAVLPPEVSLPNLESYAETITSTLYRYLKPQSLPTLYLETGRALIDEAGYLITTLHASKRLSDGRKAYIADAGINLLYSAFWYRYNIEIEREVTGVNEPSVIYGPLCMNIDVVDEGVLLPSLPRGTRLVLSPVGAYNQTQSMQFIGYRPNVVLVRENGQVDVIREKETLSDMETRECLPPDLKLH